MQGGRTKVFDVEGNQSIGVHDGERVPIIFKGYELPHGVILELAYPVYAEASKQLGVSRRWLE